VGVQWWPALYSGRLSTGDSGRQVQGHVDDAIAKGATATVGGKRPDLPAPYDKVGGAPADTRACCHCTHMMGCFSSSGTASGGSAPPPSPAPGRHRLHSPDRPSLTGACLLRRRPAGRAHGLAPRTRGLTRPA